MNPFREIKSIFFDLDDTLINYTEANHSAALAVYQAYKNEINGNAEQFIKQWNDNHQNRYCRYLKREITLTELRRSRARDVLGEQLSDARADQVVSIWTKAYTDNWRLFSDVRPCLNRFSKRKLGIITNSDKIQQLGKLTRTGICNYFRVIICSRDYPFSKPDKRIFLEACRQIGCNPEEAIYVGDMLEPDARASVKAGLRGIWLNRNNKGIVTDIEMIRSLDELVI